MVVNIDNIPVSEKKTYKKKKKKLKGCIYITSPSGAKTVFLSPEKKMMIDEEKRKPKETKRTQAEKAKQSVVEEKYKQEHEDNKRIMNGKNEVAVEAIDDSAIISEVNERILEKKENVKPKTDKMDCVVYIGKYCGREYCSKCNKSLDRFENTYISKKNKVVHESLKICKKCHLAHLSEPQYKRDTSKWIRIGYYYIDDKEFCINAKTKKKQKSIKKQEIIKNTVHLTPEEIQRKQQIAEDNRRKATLAKIERAQRKRVQIEKIKQENIKKESGKKNLTNTTDMEYMDYNKIKNVIVYVYERLYNRCVKNHSEKIKSYTALVPTVSDERKKYPINIFYCSNCQRYFVDSEAIEKFVKRRIFLRLKFNTEYTGGELRAFSELTLFGYTVKEGAMSDGERQGLLKYIIESRLMKKHEIIKQLQWNIDYIGKGPNKESAVEKWRDDIRFVRGYIWDNDPNVVITDPSFEWHS